MFAFVKMRKTTRKVNKVKIEIVETKIRSSFGSCF